jgi:polyhydroxybutyrate depolymerase
MAIGSQPNMDRRSIRVDGLDRTYWLARPDTQPAPLLIVLHGSGIPASGMARWTGLDRRSPEHGLAAAFPEGCHELWDDRGTGRLDGIDDARFIRELGRRLIDEGVARAGAVGLVGLSNGAFFAERLARHGLASAAGLVLAAGTAREISRHARRRPAAPMPVLMFEGTADPLVPYRGGSAHGPLALIARRRSKRVLVNPDNRAVVAAETVAADWASVNRVGGAPTVETLSGFSHQVRVDRLSWGGSGSKPVVLYRIAGGGHGWPGGPQYLPPFLIGTIPRNLDATGILIDFLQRTIGPA